MATMTEYKCPCCGGAIEFDTHSQIMKCPFCDTEFDVETLKSYDEALKQDAEDDIKWETQGDEWSDNSMNVYVCESCGGEIISDENTAATSCPFCDNPVILNGRLSGTLKPDLVIPFQLDKNAAKAALKKHFEGKKLLPDIFKTDSKLDEIKGVYVPFWLFDCDADANIRYRMTKIRTWSFLGSGISAVVISNSYGAFNTNFLIIYTSFYLISTARPSLYEKSAAVLSLCESSVSSGVQQPKNTSLPSISLIKVAHICKMASVKPNSKIPPVIVGIIGL